MKSSESRKARSLFYTFQAGGKNSYFAKKKKVHFNKLDSPGSSFHFQVRKDYWLLSFFPKQYFGLSNVKPSVAHDNELISAVSSGDSIFSFPRAIFK